jgi:toxin YoeB
LKNDLVFATNAWEDYTCFQQTDKKILNRINLLIKDIKIEPFKGTGEPEPKGYIKNIGNKQRYKICTYKLHKN